MKNAYVAEGVLDLALVVSSAGTGDAEKAEPVAWAVTGPYENRPFSDFGSAAAYCKGLNERYGDGVYVVSPLYTHPAPAPAVPTDVEALIASLSERAGALLEAETTMTQKIDRLKQQRDAAWEELRRIRDAIGARSGESTADEAECIKHQRDELAAALDRLSAQCERLRLPGQPMSDSEKVAKAALAKVGAGNTQHPVSTD